MPLHPLEVPASGSAIRGGHALDLHGPRDRRRAEPDRDGTVALEVRTRSGEPSAAGTQSFSDRPSGDTSGPQPRATAGSQAFVPVATPAGPAVHELDHRRIEHRRRVRLLQERNLHSAGQAANASSLLDARSVTILYRGEALESA